MNVFMQVLINGILIGGVYSLIAIGLNMIFGVMKIINFAHCDLFMIGMYSSFTFYEILKLSTTFNPFLLIIPVGVIMFLIGILIFKVLVKPIIGSDSLNFVLLTVGLSYFLQNVAQMIWSADPKTINTDVKLKKFYLEKIRVSIPYTKLIAFVLAIILVILVYYFLQKTDTGRAMRATSESAQIAALLGINTEKSYIVAFGLGTMFAGIAGVMLSPVYSIYPRIGTLFATTVFAIVVLGGLGNIKGTLFAGLLVGIVENYVGTYIALDLAPVAVFVLFVVVMIFKPNGLFGGGIRKA